MAASRGYEMDESPTLLKVEAEAEMKPEIGATVETAGPENNVKAIDNGVGVDVADAEEVINREDIKAVPNDGTKCPGEGPARGDTEGASAVETAFATAATAATAAAVAAVASAEAITSALAAVRAHNASTAARSRDYDLPTDGSRLLDEARSLLIPPSKATRRPKIRFDPMMLSYHGAYYFEDELPESGFPNLGHCNSKQWVKLNVGGMWFLTTKTTLCRDQNSFFCKLVGGDTVLTSDTDHTGAFMIDRDPTYFVPVLNYLRHGKIVLNRDMIEEGLLEEAEFYNLRELMRSIKVRIADRKAKATPPPEVKKKTVYRVIHFHELEISQLISTMTDGWKFEQIVTIGSIFSYLASDRSEFLCIVSREFEDTYDPRESSDRIRYLQQKGTL